jgi:hypothetical protein
MTNRQLAVAVPLVFLLGALNGFLFGYACALEWAGPRRPLQLASLAAVILFMVFFVTRLEMDFIGELLRRRRAQRGQGPGGKSPTT